MEAESQGRDQPPVDLEKRAAVFSAGGLAIWLLAAGKLHPALFARPWAEALLALAALVLVPLVLRLVLATYLAPGRGRGWQWIVYGQPIAALVLAVAIGWVGSRGQGHPAAGIASLPWTGLSCAVAWQGFDRLRRRGLSSWPETAIDSGLIFLSIGGVWTSLHCFGLRPLGFEPVIVLLTGIHFHYAGFVLPVLTGLAGREHPSRPADLAAAGVVAGVPLVALGITATQLGLGPVLETAAALVTALAGLLTATLHLRLAARPGCPLATRTLWAAAALSLAFAMILSAVYGARAYFDVAWLDIPWMRAFHGTSNALGFALCGALGWSLARRAKPT